MHACFSEFVLVWVLYLCVCLCLPLAGVDHSLVHWLPVSDPGLFPCVPGWEGGQRDVCNLCWCSLVGSGKQHHIVWTAMFSCVGIPWEVPNLQLIQRIKTMIQYYHTMRLTPHYILFRFLNMAQNADPACCWRWKLLMIDEKYSCCSDTIFYHTNLLN